MMKWYPWLNIHYRRILLHYQQSRGHHALLLYSRSGNGEASLCYALSRWLMCQQKNSIKSCGVCHNCLLMIADSCPDFYYLKPDNNCKNLGMDSISIIIDKVYNYSYHDGIKVIWLSHAELLTEQATNALLKTLEEPPLNTYFLLSTQTLVRLLPTLKSRCLCWTLSSPDEVTGLQWLKKAGFDDLLSIRTALRLCSNAPLEAEALLHPKRWKERMVLCMELYNIHHSNNNFLTLLPVLNRDNDNGPLYWLLSLLADALKWQYDAQDFLINADKADLVALLASHWMTKILHSQWQQWLQCLRQCQEINGVNRELLITHYLLNWEQEVRNSYIVL